MRGISEKTLETGERVRVEMQFNVYKVTLAETSSDVKLHLSDDLVETKWFDLRDLSSVKLTPPSIELFKRLGYTR